MTGFVSEVPAITGSAVSSTRLAQFGRVVSGIIRRCSAALHASVKRFRELLANEIAIEVADEFVRCDLCLEFFAGHHCCDLQVIGECLFCGDTQLLDVRGNCRECRSSSIANRRFLHTWRRCSKTKKEMVMPA